MNLEHCRKQAKALRRDVGAGDQQALARATAVLGPRASSRLVLSDAQYVIAVERGCRSWRELLDVARRERLLDTELAYLPGDPVQVRVIRRPHRVTVTDDAGALVRAAVSSPWRAVADRLERELDVNISRTGAVWLPVVTAGPREPAILERIARASLTFYQDLLELE